MWRVFEQMPQTVRSGEAAIRSVFGVDHYWTYLHNEPVARKVFNAGMAAVSRAFHIPTVLSYDYSGVRRITDIGGGLGQVLTAILRANPHLEGQLLDQADTVADARPLLAEYGVADRCTAVAGDMFQAVPEGSDLYLLSFVLMDWDDEHALRLLRNIAAVLPVDGRVLVIDCLQDLSSNVPDGRGHPYHPGRTIDLFQMCMGSARVRNRAEFENLFA
jgi:C-methyltransferase